MHKNDLYFCKLKESAIIPNKRDEDAGYDFYPCFDYNHMTINPTETILIHTGIGVVIDSSKYMQLIERSSLAKKGIKVSAGIIDSGYRGEIMVALYNTNIDKFVIIEKTPTDMDEEQFIKIPYGSAICQGIIHESHKMNTSEISYDEFMTFDSNRGKCGFGSTNKII